MNFLHKLPNYLPLYGNKEIDGLVNIIFLLFFTIFLVLICLCVIVNFYSAYKTFIIIFIYF